VASAVAKGLRQRGVDAVTAAESNMLGAADIEHLQFAASNQRVIFTQDHDFLRLHAAGISHAGVAYSRQSTSIGSIVRGLMLIYHVLTADDMQDHLEYL
jgi:hypothetical protein